MSVGDHVTSTRYRLLKRKLKRQEQFIRSIGEKMVEACVRRNHATFSLSERYGAAHTNLLYYTSFLCSSSGSCM